MKILSSTAVFLLLSMSIPCSMAQSDCWSWMVGGAGSEKVDALTIDPVGNIWIAGVYQGTVDFDPDTGTTTLSSQNFQDGFLASYDQDGGFRFAYSLPNIGINDIVADSSGNVYATGFHFGNVDADPGPGVDLLPAFGGIDACVVSFDSSGTYRWGRGYGSAGGEEGTSLDIDAAGDVLIAGYYFLSVDFETIDSTKTLTSEGGSDVFVGKFTSDGDLSWVFGYGGTGFEENPVVKAAGQLLEFWTAMNYETWFRFPAIGGDINLTSNGEADIAIARSNSSGEILDAYSMGGPGRDIPGDLAIDGNNNLYLSGSFRGSMDADPGAGTRFITSKGESDAFIASLSFPVKLNWVRRIGGIGSENAPVVGLFDHTLETQTILSVFGNFTDSTELQKDSSLSTTFLLSNGFIDSYLAKYGIESGDLLDVKQLGGTEADVAGHIRFLPPPHSGEAILTGASSGAVNLPPFTAPPICGTASLQFPQGSFDFHVSRIPVVIDSSTAVFPEIKALPLKAYPNPVGDFLILAYPQGGIADGLLQIRIYDLGGRRVQIREVQPKEDTQIVSVENLPHGLYMIEVIDNSGQSFSSRFVKE